MGSAVLPYFISSQEKFTFSNDPGNLTPEQVHAQNAIDRTPPITPAPSANTSAKRKERRPKSKKVLKYKIPELKRHESVRKKMEIIKEKLEKSRERYKERQRLQEESELKECGPTIIGLDEHGDIPKLDRSMSDLGPSVSSRYPTKRADGSFPYVYFVVSQDTVAESEEFGLESDENEQIVKSAKVRRRKIFMEQNRKRKEKQAQTAKIQGIARELGLKSNPIPKPFSEERPATQPAINHIVFPIAATSSTNLRRIHSPPRIPPSTPATTVCATSAYESPDPDETVPRKPFLSGPLYAGKPKVHSYSLHTFELPFIPPDQRKRTLGLASSDNFGDCFMSKPQSQQRQRKVTFADTLPVIRGSGFVFNDKELRKSTDDLPNLGPRAATMGSITLPSEKADKREKCQKDHISDKEAVKLARKMGIPLALPKIDIVSNVYDEMIIKMIRDYLQDSNTPTRQAQLARELLVQLQENETIKQMQKLHEEEEAAAQMREEAKSKRESKKKSNNNDTRTENKQLEAGMKTHVTVTGMPTFEEIHNNKPKTPSTPVATARNTPLVKITYKSSKEGIEGDALQTEFNHVKDGGDSALKADALPNSANGARDTLSSSKKERCSVTPIAFKMPPPGLSREETNLSISQNL